MKDKIVAEVRRYRHAHTKKCGGDLRVICDDLRQVEQRLGLKTVRLMPRKLPANGRRARAHA